MQIYNEVMRMASWLCLNNQRAKLLYACALDTACLQIASPV